VGSEEEKSKKGGDEIISGWEEPGQSFSFLFIFLFRQAPSWRRKIKIEEERERP
jgi:hypothetical protein